MEEGRNQERKQIICDVSAEQQGQCLLQRYWNCPTWGTSRPAPSYPPISSIPKTSPERLALASVDDPSASAKTILYLAYGSNLCAETFLGRRGIRPLSQVNVSAPAFDLTFDLPGIPYNEPCFANTRPRKIPKPPVPGQPPLPPLPPGHGGPAWTKGLYGVVYEVTPEDYANIIKTEGGGQGYHDVLTLCFELPPAMTVPEKPPIPELPKPFLAHTLYAPSLPDLPGNDDDNDDDGGDDPIPPKEERDGDPGRQPWARRLFLPVHRPNADYAQASTRYLKLIRDGAREHALPDDYQAYLARLQPYTITSIRQQIGRALFLLLALPLMLPILVLGRLLADDNGRTPRWLGLATMACMNLTWAAYDGFFKPVFGDGERTILGDEDEDAEHRRVRTLMDGTGSEKSSLLDDW
jgi:hypothetical protein